MKHLGKTLVIALAAFTLAATGCGGKKKDNAGAGTGTSAGTAAGTAAGTGAGTAAGTATPTPPTPTPTPATAVDYIKINADHVDAAKGPVTVTFSSWKVTEAKFDPANLEGGTATVEVDPTALASGDPKRDEHLKTPDFLDAAKFPKAIGKVDNVKKTGEGAYSADLTISLHGVEKKWPVNFTVVTSTPDSVTIALKQPFGRADFSVGPKETDNIKNELTLDAVLTFKKS